jgi:hypothetical protein
VVPIIRISLIFNHNLIILKRTIAWLFESREFTNFLYEITSLNRNQMIGGISSITGNPITEVEKIFMEIENDQQFRINLDNKAKNISRHNELLFPIPIARRIVWYCLIRITKPGTVVETGTEKGLGSLIIQRALDMKTVPR